jgi:hypothetical protein
MNKPFRQILDFMGSPVGLVVCFIVIFYLVTFAVYYFYSPGPEERKEQNLWQSPVANGLTQAQPEESQVLH